MLASYNGPGQKLLQPIQTGFYLIKDHDQLLFTACSGGLVFLQKYGLCDNVSQFLTTDIYNSIVESTNSFFVLLTSHNKQDSAHFNLLKNGLYIGARQLQNEYLGDEPNIDLIYQFRIYRKDLIHDIS